VSVHREIGGLDRALAALLLVLMLVGSLALWIGVPAAILWALGQAVNDPAEHLILGLLGVPAGMALWGAVLAWLNGAYLRVSGGLEDRDGGWVPTFQGPLDSILGLSAVIAIAALLAWMTFADNVTGPVAPW
jgi:hypothetical protein